jgi:hypothetical protein
MTHRYTWRKVASRRNSECGSMSLDRLDFENWWTDGGEGSFNPHGVYLHVPIKPEDDSGWNGTVHRVHCRHSDEARLGMREGVLCWIFKTEVPK